MMKALQLLLVALLAFTSTACKQTGDESDHKLAFPKSAVNFQNRGNSNSFLPDRGIATMVEIDSKDLDGFVAQLKITERRKPAQEHGDPTVNGWNVWPQGAKTFVPGNEIFGGFMKTWTTEPVPVEMLACQSDAGGWLHVEIWRLSETKTLLKPFTDWN